MMTVVVIILWITLSFGVLTTRAQMCNREMKPIETIGVLLICLVGGPVIALGTTLDVVLSILLVDDDDDDELPL